jgi:peptidylprolyl isomerase
MRPAALAFALALSLNAPAQDKPAYVPPTTAEVIANAGPDMWRTPDPDDVLYLDVPAGRVVIELADAFAPEHAENIRRMAKEHYWDGLAILRSQENYVVQWGDPDGEDEAKARPFQKAKKQLPAEFSTKSGNVRFTRLMDGDVYAPEVGWSDGFPAARDPKLGQAWLAHCYAAVGAGRGNPADSSNGAELYVVIGHSPRHLDRNITLVGRVLQGMEHLTTLPRGTGALGFYETAEQRTPIKVRLASDVPENERVPLEVFRTDTAAFKQLIEARRNRREEWFHYAVGKVELCNVPIPVRMRPAAAP